MKQARVTKNGQKSPSRNIARTKDARDKLLKVGLAVFLKEGSGNLSVRSVAAKAGVNLGSFVYHFKTKDAFIEEIIYSHYDELVAILNKATEGLDANQDPLTTLKRVIEVFNEAARSAPLAFRLFMDVLQGEEVILKAAIKNPPSHILFVMDAIKKCQAKGQIRKDMDARMVLILIVSVMGFPTLVSHQILKNSSKSGPLKEMASLITGEQARKDRLEIILKGLKP